MPAFNAESTLAQAVESALAQTVGDLEVLVVDDGSAVPAAEVLADIRDDRLRIVRHDRNRGLSAARNTALAAVTTPFMSQLDADDLWEPDYLESILPCFENGEIGLTYTDARILYENGETAPYLTSGLDHPIDTFPELARRNPIAALTVTARTEAVRAVGGYASWLWGAQDYHLYLKLAAAGWRFAYVDRPLGLYRWPDERGAMSSDLRKVILTDLKLFTAFKLRHPTIPGPGRRAIELAGQAARRHTPVLSPAARRVRAIASGDDRPVDDPRQHGDRLRVVTLVGWLGRDGGAERLALDTTLGLDPERFERTLVVSRWPATMAVDPGALEIVAELEAAAVRFLGLDRGRPGAIWHWLPLLRLLRSERIDVVHAHMFGSNLWATILGRLAGVPVIVTHEHTWSFEGQPIRRFLDRELIARFGSRCIAVSADDRRKMIEIEGIPPDDIVLLPNGISAPPNGPHGDVRAELGIAATAPVVGAVGNLRPQKNTVALVEAVAELAPDFPDLRLLLVGHGPERQRVIDRARELAVEEHVLLLGQRKDVWDILAALDVAVLASIFEGSPLSVMEYMEAGLPVVATSVGGVPDLVDDGVSGLLVEPRDPVALAAAIRSLLQDPARAADMGARGRRRRREEFDIAVMVRRMEDLYERLYTEATGKPGPN
jgi:glycosyltransferase involved in cell wall biosynthesis